MKSSNPLSNALLCILLGGVGAAVTWVYLNNSKIVDTLVTSSSSSISSDTQPRSASSNSGLLTRANYDKVKDGMTYAQVRAILGEGESSGEIEVAGSVTSTYSWITADYSIWITVTFDNGISIGKTQSGF